MEFDLFFFWILLCRLTPCSGGFVLPRTAELIVQLFYCLIVANFLEIEDMY